MLWVWNAVKKTKWWTYKLGEILMRFTSGNSLISPVSEESPGDFLFEFLLAGSISSKSINYHSMKAQKISEEEMSEQLPKVCN